MTDQTLARPRTLELVPLCVSAAALAALAFAVGGWSWLLMGLLSVAVVTWPLAATDVAQHRLPNVLVLPCYPVAAVSIAAHILATGASPALPLVVAGIALGGFVIMHLLGGMGMGDVKLAGVLGMLLGALGLTSAMVGFAAAFALGALAGAWAMATRQRAVTHRIPFGPFLLAGFWIGVAAHAVAPV